MLVLSALCVLLPLAAALDTCDDKTAKAFLAKKQLGGDLLHCFDGTKFWFASIAKEGSDSNVNSVEVSFDSVKEQSVEAHFIYRDSNGTTIQYVSSTYTLEVDHILALKKTVSLYFFPCSKNLIAGYRCAVEGCTASGPKYYIWAVWDKTDAEISGELAACKEQIRMVDETVIFTDRVRPCNTEL